MPRRSPYLIYLPVALLAGLWLLNWGSNRPLFLDEANVARNLFDQSYPGLFHPLDHEQYAPPLYLVLAKLSGDLFGYAEWSLRLPSLFGTVLAVAGLLSCGRSLKLNNWMLLPLTALALNVFALRYLVELKPYGLDLGIAATLLALFLRNPRPTVAIAAAGCVAPWLSLPSVFILAGGGAWAFFRPKQTTKIRLAWLKIAAGWLLSFGLLYYLTLRHSLSESSLTAYHQAYFFPVRAQAGGVDVGATLDLLYRLLKVAFGHTVLSITTGTLLALIGWVTATERKGWLLAAPLLLAMLVSAGGYYSLIPRLVLFTLPGWWLGAALGARQLYRRGGKLRWLALGLAVASVSGVDWPNHFRPVAYSDSRRLVTTYDAEYLPVLNILSFPTFDYYHRIHPRGEGLPAYALSTETLSEEQSYVLLYDVLTSTSSWEQLQQEQMRATARGCRVRLEEQFRAAALYVDCQTEPFQGDPE